jgi:release factor glutamine methyltransferase
MEVQAAGKGGVLRPSLTYLAYRFLYKPFLHLYLRRDRKIRFKGFRLQVLKGVFHPALFFSSSYLYDFIGKLPLKGKSFLEIGCGSGLLSMLAFKQGAGVTAVDISHQAVENTKVNFRLNFTEHAQVSVLKSDVFSNIPETSYDLIVINPPYYFNAPATEAAYAWNCGAEGEFFNSLFAGLKDHLNPGGTAYMILADVCDIDRINSLAKRKCLELREIERKKIRWETSIIFQIVAQSSN